MDYTFSLEEAQGIVLKEFLFVSLLAALKIGTRYKHKPIYSNPEINPLNISV